MTRRTSAGLMAPIALAIAADLRASPYPFAMIVALALSASSVTPISSPVNTLVVGPGNYQPVEKSPLQPSGSGLMVMAGARIDRRR